MDRVKKNIAALATKFQDDIFNLSYRSTQEISKRFGNVVGLYEERKGKLFDMRADERKRLTDELQTLDIFLEKTPFRLTDLFIPGYWGHVAVWVGGSNDIPELKRLGVWDELPRIEAEARRILEYDGPSFQELIEGDRGVLEALRPGVELNTFAQFLNIDDLAVMRADSISDVQKRHYLLHAFAQIGKPYDFNFDIATHQRIVCSELVFVVYDDYDWPVEQVIGRYAISPDHVAALAREKDDPFTPVILYHDGKELPADHHGANFNLLLEGAQDRIIF